MIDGHAHLNEIEDIGPALERARKAGVQAVIAVGMDIPSNRTTLSLAAKFPGIVHPAVGFHPWSITPENLDANLSFVESALPDCIALGEIGLDYGAKSKKKIQQGVLDSLLGLASRFDKPVIIHSRYSHQRTHRMVREAGLTKAVFHWYSGPLDTLEMILADGYHISVTPALAYSEAHRAAAAVAPLDRILVETDSPVEYRGKRAEPADVVSTIRELSLIKGVSFEAIAQITEQNLLRVFGFRTVGGTGAE